MFVYRRQRGFTLIELLIVIAIIGVLAAIALPLYKTHTIKARLTEGIHPEAVWLSHGYGHGVKNQKLAYGKGVNDNLLVGIRAEPIAGGAALAETLVTVRKG